MGASLVLIGVGWARPAKVMQSIKRKQGGE